MNYKYIILMIFILFPSKPEYKTTEIEERFNIHITGARIIIKSVFPFGEVVNSEELKKGLNEGYWVLNEGQSFEYKIINY